VSSASTSGASSGASSGTSSGRGALVIILTVIGILAIIAGILYVSGAANSIHFMVSVHHGHHQVRAIVAFVIGIACLIGAYIAHTRPAAAASASGTDSASPSGTGGPRAVDTDSASASETGGPRAVDTDSASAGGTGSDGGTGGTSPSESGS